MCRQEGAREGCIDAGDAQTSRISQTHNNRGKEKGTKTRDESPGHPYQKEEGSLPPGRGKNQDLQGPKTRYKIMNENIVGTEKKTAQHISHNAQKTKKIIAVK